MCTLLCVWQQRHKSILCVTPVGTRDGVFMHVPVLYIAETDSFKKGHSGEKKYTCIVATLRSESHLNIRQERLGPHPSTPPPSSPGPPGPPGGGSLRISG